MGNNEKEEYGFTVFEFKDGNPHLTSAFTEKICKNFYQYGIGEISAKVFNNNLHEQIDLLEDARKRFPDKSA